MKFNDKIYDKQEISEPVLIELINSDSVQRLKEISQLGMPDKYGWKKGFSRYEHSVGVLMLLKNLGADLEEQVAGLLHDVSHTTFSHIIDWLLGNPEKEDYQDKTLLKTIKTSEIPKILLNFGFDYTRISHHSNFSLLERDAPSLCADRIDYALREIAFDKGNLFSKKIYCNLTVKSNQIVFREKAISNLFAEEYAQLQKNSWGSDVSLASYHILSCALKRGLEKRLISLKDFNNTEAHILNILENSNDKFILDKLNLLEKGFYVVESPRGIELKNKFRYVDPEVLVNGSFKNLSSLSKEYSDFLESEKENAKFPRALKIIPK